MNSFIDMREISFYYKEITKEWKKVVQEKSKESAKQKIHLYHYTSTEVLDKILQNATFWATNIFYLNDSSEFKAGIESLCREVRKWDEGCAKEIVEGYLAEIEKYDGYNWPGIYSISFSTLYDELQQWITYAKESGVCIELDYDIVEKEDLMKPRLLLKQKSNDGEFIPVSENYNGFGSLSYGSEEEGKNDSSYGEKEIKDTLYSDFANICRKLKWEEKTITADEMQSIWVDKEKEAKQYLALAASYHKERGFSGEGEVRISFFPLQMRNALKSTLEKTEIKYCQRKDGILRPYIEIFFFQGTDSTPRCPIKSIMIGPSGKQQYVYDSVVHRLKYGQVNVWKYPIEERFNLLKEYINTCKNTLSADERNNLVLVNQIYNIIAKEWIEESDDVFYEKSERTVCIESDFIKLDKPKVLYSAYDVTEYSETQLQEFHEIAAKRVAEFKKKEFLTKHGIWVKKSQIPYLY